MVTFRTGRDSLESLAEFINAKIVEEHAAVFSSYPSPARCVPSDDLPPDTEEPNGRIRSPYAVLRVERDVNRPMGLVDIVYDCTLRCEVKATELSGARRTGAAKADSTLSRVIAQILEEHSTELDELGFGSIKSASGAETTRRSRGAGRLNQDLLRIEFWYLRPHGV